MSFGSVLFTPAVKALQERYGSRRQYEALVRTKQSGSALTTYESAFLSERDTFYWATISSSGWPYVQHRGGPKGFVKVVDPQTLAFADFAGNKQFISTGNLATDSRVALIFVDYASQIRLKILGRANVFEGEESAQWRDIVEDTGYSAKIERVFTIHVEAYDWNCPQHIVPRYTTEQIESVLERLRNKIETLEAENAALKSKLALS